MSMQLVSRRQRLNKKLIQSRFDKACHSYATHNFVQHQIAEHLLSLLPAVDKPVSRLVDLGCGPGPNWNRLKPLGQCYIGIDLSHRMLNAHPASSRLAPKQLDISHTLLLQADMEQLPLADASVDLIFSSMAVQWAHCRDGLIKELARVLKPGASAFLSMPLQGTLQPLADIRHRIDSQLQVNAQPSLSSWQSSIDGCDLLRIQDASQRSFSQYFSNLSELLHSIKGVGAGANSAAPLTRQTLQKLSKSYERQRNELGLPLHYKVGFFHLQRIKDA